VSKTHQFKVLRVEETPVAGPAGNVVTEAIPATPAGRPATDTVDYWRKMAINASDRLKIAEEQAKALREAADDARARFGKYKDRLDKAQERVNHLTVDVVRLSADNEELRAKLARQETLAREIHQYRQSLLEGPIWNLFTELAVSPHGAGEEKR
jgi:septal ring factor EnvC (AmiA/AmiB activator)